MKILLRLVIWRWQVGTLAITLDIEEPSGLVVPEDELPPPRLMDKVSDYFAGRYIQRRLVQR